jgi:hypothetical protein
MDRVAEETSEGAVADIANQKNLKLAPGAVQDKETSDCVV